MELETSSEPPLDVVHQGGGLLGAIPHIPVENLQPAVVVIELLAHVLLFVCRDVCVVCCEISETCAEAGLKARVQRP